MKKIEKWLNINRLQLNVSKTKVMLVRGIRKKVSESNIKIKLDNAVLEVISEIKYLGVMINKNLNFTAYVNYLGKKIDSKLGVFRRIRVNLTPYMRCVIYKVIIAPLLEYCALSILLTSNTTQVPFIESNETLHTSRTLKNIRHVFFYTCPNSFLRVKTIPRRCNIGMVYK